MKTPMSVSDTRQSLHWELGQFYMPHGICLATVFNWLRHRNEAPKSALHFGPGRYRLYWNRFHIGTGSRYCHGKRGPAFERLLSRVGYQYNQYLPGPKCNADFGASFRCLSQLNTVARQILWGTCK